MPSNLLKYRLPLAWRIVIMAVGWLVIVSALHWWLNFDHGKRRVVKMGYMPVITNLAAPILDHATVNGDGIRFSSISGIGVNNYCYACLGMGFCRSY